MQPCKPSELPFLVLVEYLEFCQKAKRKANLKLERLTKLRTYLSEAGRDELFCFYRLLLPDVRI